MYQRGRERERVECRCRSARASRARHIQHTRDETRNSPRDVSYPRRGLSHRRQHAPSRRARTRVQSESAFQILRQQTPPCSASRARHSPARALCLLALPIYALRASGASSAAHHPIPHTLGRSSRRTPCRCLPHHRLPRARRQLQGSRAVAASWCLLAGQGQLGLTSTVVVDVERRVATDVEAADPHAHPGRCALSCDARPGLRALSCGAWCACPPCPCCRRCHAGRCRCSCARRSDSTSPSRCPRR